MSLFSASCMHTSVCDRAFFLLLARHVCQHEMPSLPHACMCELYIYIYIYIYSYTYIHTSNTYIHVYIYTDAYECFRNVRGAMILKAVQKHAYTYIHLRTRIAEVIGA